jgi:hypothetical protein
MVTAVLRGKSGGHHTAGLKDGGRGPEPREPGTSGSWQRLARISMESLGGVSPAHLDPRPAGP